MTVEFTVRSLKYISKLFHFHRIQIVTLCKDHNNIIKLLKHSPNVSQTK